MQRQGLRLTTREKNVLWIATILILLLIGARSARWTGFSGRTPWEYLDVFLVPVAVGVATLWFTSEQNRRQREADRAQEKIALDAEERRAQDEALQAYLDKMSELLIDKKLHEKKGDYDPARVTARAQTLAVLRRLEADHKRTILLFLREARLINRHEYSPKEEPSVTYYAHYVGLEDADFSGTDLQGTRLISSSEKEPIFLKGANFRGAKLRRAILRRADLSGADLSGADLSGADLSGADLTNATVTDAQLGTCESLKGATMTDGEILKSDLNPHGPTFEEWLKSKSSGEDG